MKICQISFKILLRDKFIINFINNSIFSKNSQGCVAITVLFFRKICVIIINEFRACLRVCLGFSILAGIPKLLLQIT